MKTNTYALFFQQNPSLTESYLWYLYRQNLIMPFWKIFKKLWVPYMGLLYNNITKSLNFHTIRALNLLLSKKNIKTQDVLPIPKNSYPTLTYLSPVPTVYLSFQKTLYNKLVTYFLQFNLTFYPGSHLFFKLTYGFLFVFTYLRWYPFCNQFFFKVRNH